MAPGGTSGGSDSGKRSREYSLRKYILLLATVVATVTYSAGFSPPGGVWEETDLTAGNLAGDPIMRRTSYARFVAFFYLNVAAFASSLLVAVIILLVMKCDYLGTQTYVLRGFMVLDLLSILGAYTAGTYREGEMASVYTMILATLTVAYVVGIMVMAYVLSADSDMTKSSTDNNDHKRDKDCKLLMLLTTFCVSLTYLSGLSVPGGFRQHGDEGGHRQPGDPTLLGGRHQTRLQAFACFNSTAFFCSLLITVQLLDKNRRLLHAFVAVAIICLVGAYASGSSRDTVATIYVLLVAVGLMAIIVLRKRGGEEEGGDKEEGLPTATTTVSNEEEVKSRSSLVVLFATLAATITYQAGLHPPGGLWEKNGDGYVAGDPILRTTNPRRYDAFFYCNSAAFVASLIVIILVRKRTIVNHTTLHALRAALILDVFGLIGAYAAGSCRDVATSIYTMALAGAVPVYMVIHVAFIALDHKQQDAAGEESDDKVAVEKKRKRLLLFAVLAANITYQAGLTPPGGFWELGHRAGKPVLLSNFPRRYTAFFYCNSVSFMLSIALVIILVNPKLYRPAIKSHSLSICGVAGMFSLVGAFAAGSTQHLRTSIKIFGMVAVIVIVILLVVRCTYKQPEVCYFDSKQSKKDKIHSRRKKLMLLGILAASVTYQAGLDPPGGVWQDDDGGHIAGNPIMRDNRWARYQAFFYINSSSFVASIVVIMLLLLRPKGGRKWWSLVAIMDTTIVLDLLALLLAYAVGSTRSGKDAGYVIALVFSVLAYIAIYAVIYAGIHVWQVSTRNNDLARGQGRVDPPTDSHRPNQEISESNTGS